MAIDFCKYCSENDCGSYVISKAPYVRLELENIFGDVAMIAHGDNDCSYEPKYCPECGRRLKGEIEYD